MPNDNFEGQESQNQEDFGGKEDSKGQGKSPAERNPCGICRASGLPVCKGHGGGGGGGGGGSSESAKEDKSASPVPAPQLKGSALSTNPAPSIDLVALLNQNEDWTNQDDLDSAFKFENPEALFTIEMDMELGSLTFSGNKDLSKEQQDTLDEFFNAIENELIAFKNELTTRGENPTSLAQIKLTRERNALTLKLPTPTIYDAFIQRVVDKNILPVKPAPQPGKTQEMKISEITSQSKAQVPETSKPPEQSTAPTPFNIKNGPTPKGLQ